MSNEHDTQPAVHERYADYDWHPDLHRAQSWQCPAPERETGYPRSWWAAVLVCAAAALVITLTGCGGGDEGEGDTVYVNYHPEKKPTPPEALL